MRLRAASLFIALMVAALSAGAMARAADGAPSGQPPKPQAENPAPPSPSEMRAEIYARLAASRDADETEGLVGLLVTAYAQSGSDTGDLLLKRAHKAIEAKDYKAAEKILDATILLLPDWAEGWNVRATLRYLDGDYDGSMADIAQTLKREPRHLGALLGMASILQSRDNDDEALKVYQRVLEIAPHWKSAEEAADKLKAEIAGQNL
jgi:tetratricopeptide (TPR) repeat protein